MSDTKSIAHGILDRVAGSIERDASRQARIAAEKLMGEMKPLLKTAGADDMFLESKIESMIANHLRERSIGEAQMRLARHLLDSSMGGPGHTSVSRDAGGWPAPNADNAGLISSLQ